VMEIYEAAKEMEIAQIVKFCTDFVGQSMSPTNAVKYFDQSILFNNEQVQQSSLKFIEENTKQCMKESTFPNISQTTLQHILQDDNLMIPEEDLFEAVVAWGRWVWETNSANISELM